MSVIMLDLWVCITKTFKWPWFQINDHFQAWTCSEVIPTIDDRANCALSDIQTSSVNSLRPPDYLWWKADAPLQPITVSKSASFNTHKSVGLCWYCFRNRSYVSSLQLIHQFDFCPTRHRDLVLLHIFSSAATWPSCSSAACVLLSRRTFKLLSSITWLWNWDLIQIETNFISILEGFILCCILLCINFKTCDFPIYSVVNIDILHAPVQGIVPNFQIYS